MADNDWKKRLGVVYSTNPDFQYETEEISGPETLEPAAQKLFVTIDRRNRGGEITIQGDQRDKVTAILNEMGYKAKRGN